MVTLLSYNLTLDNIIGTLVTRYDYRSWITDIVFLGVVFLRISYFFDYDYRRNIVIFLRKT